MDDSIDNIEIPGYIIEERIGSGAMATVYLATHKNLGRKVALKLMSAELVADSTFRERFQREGQTVAQFTHHPNIVTIFDIVTVDPYYYMTMEYIDGVGTLKERIKKGLSTDEAVKILIQIASALGYAHAHADKIIHRDVKPTNILFRQNGDAVLSDFGIAKALELGGADLTQKGFAVGTPAYMSPEQVLGKPVDARSDLYSLGIVFYEMLTGKKPYQADDTFALALMQINQTAPDLPPELARFQPVIDRSLAKDPAERFANAEEMIAAVQAISKPVEKVKEEHPPPPPGDAASKTTRIPYWTIWLLIVGITMGLSGLLLHFFGDRIWPPAIEEKPCTPVTLDDGQALQIERLLNSARLQFEFERLIFPPGSNAADLYSRVLAIDPCNETAQTSLQQIADKIIAKAETNIAARQRLEETLAEIEETLQWLPENERLNELKAAVEQNLQQ